MHSYVNKLFIIYTMWQNIYLIMFLSIIEKLNDSNEGKYVDDFWVSSEFNGMKNGYMQDIH